MAEPYSPVCIYLSLYPHSSIHGHWRYLHVSAAVGNVAVSMDADTVCPLGAFPDVALLCLMEALFLII